MKTKNQPKRFAPLFGMLWHPVAGQLGPLAPETRRVPRPLPCTQLAHGAQPHSQGCTGRGPGAVQLAVQTKKETPEVALSEGAEMWKLSQNSLAHADRQSHSAATRSRSRIQCSALAKHLLPDFRAAANTTRTRNNFRKKVWSRPKAHYLELALQAKTFLPQHLGNLALVSPHMTALWATASVSDGTQPEISVLRFQL